MPVKRKRKRAEPGSGSIRRKGNALFEYRVSYVTAYGEHKRKSFTGKDEFECKEKARRFLEKNDKSKQSDFDLTLTIPQIARRKADKNFEYNYTKEPTYRRNLETIKIIERTPLGSVPIVDIDDAILEEFLCSLKRYANSSIQKIYQVVKSAFAWAKDNQLIDINIITAHNIRCPRSDKKDKEVQALTVEEQKKLMEYLAEYKPYTDRNVYTIQLMIEMLAGLRMGEINALRREDIDLQKKVICVRGTIQRGMDDEILLSDTPKTSTGVRQVPIMNSLLPFVHKALEEYQDNENGLLFYDHVYKKMITTAQVNNFYIRTCKKLGIKSAGQHCLRHTFATRCIEAGVDAVVLKNWMGHTNIHVTLDTYADVFASLHNSSIDRFGDYMNTVI